MSRTQTSFFDTIHNELLDTGGRLTQSGPTSWRLAFGSGKTQTMNASCSDYWLTFSRPLTSRRRELTQETFKQFLLANGLFNDGVRIALVNNDVWGLADVPLDEDGSPPAQRIADAVTALCDIDLNNLPLMSSPNEPLSDETTSQLAELCAANNWETEVRRELLSVQIDGEGHHRATFSRISEGGISLETIITRDVPAASLDGIATYLLRSAAGFRSVAPFASVTSDDVQTFQIGWRASWATFPSAWELDQGISALWVVSQETTSDVRALSDHEEFRATCV